jgi:hypothetical protein
MQSLSAARLLVNQHVTCGEVADLLGRDDLVGDVTVRPATPDPTFEKIEEVGALAHPTRVSAQFVEVSAVDRTVDRRQAHLHVAPVSGPEPTFGRGPTA